MLRASVPSLTSHHCINNTSPCISNMRPHPTTRRSSSQLFKHPSRRWIAAQMVSALHRKIQLGRGIREAVQHVNAMSHAVHPHVLSRASVQRMYKLLPLHLRDPCTTTEGLLLDFLQRHQSSQRQLNPCGRTLLTSTEESLLVERIQQQVNINTPVKAAEVKEAALGIIREQRGTEYAGLRRRDTGERVLNPACVCAVCQFMV